MILLLVLGSLSWIILYSLAFWTGIGITQGLVLRQSKGQPSGGWLISCIITGAVSTIGLIVMPVELMLYLSPITYVIVTGIIAKSHRMHRSF